MKPSRQTAAIAPMPPALARRSFVASIGICAFALKPARAEWLRDEIVVYADPALRPVLAALNAQFRSASGIRARCFCAPPGQMLGLLAHKTQDDVLITQAPFIADAASRGLTRGNATPLWRNHLVFAARGAAAPPVAFDAAHFADGKLALPDMSDASTIDGPALLAQIDPAGKIKNPILGAADTQDAVAMVRRGEADSALCHISEVSNDPDIAAVFTISQDEYKPIEYQAALSIDAWSRYQDTYLTWLRTEAAPAARGFGLEVLS